MIATIARIAVNVVEEPAINLSLINLEAKNAINKPMRNFFPFFNGKSIALTKSTKFYTSFNFFDVFLFK